MDSRSGFQRTFLIFSNEDVGFEAGQKPSGHIRLEVREGKGKLHVTAQNLRSGNGRFDYGLYLLRAAEPIAYAKAGILEVKPGKAELEWTFDPTNVAGSGYGINGFDTVVVLAEYAERQGEIIHCPLAAYKTKQMEWRNGLRSALLKKKAEPAAKPVKDAAMAVPVKDTAMAVPMKDTVPVKDTAMALPAEDAVTAVPGPGHDVGPQAGMAAPELLQNPYMNPYINTDMYPYEGTVSGSPSQMGFQKGNMPGISPQQPGFDMMQQSGFSPSQMPGAQPVPTFIPVHFPNVIQQGGVPMPAQQEQTCEDQPNQQEQIEPKQKVMPQEPMKPAQQEPMQAPQPEQPWNAYAPEQPVQPWNAVLPQEQPVQGQAPQPEQLWNAVLPQEQPVQGQVLQPEQLWNAYPPEQPVQPMSKGEFSSNPYAAQQTPQPVQPEEAALAGLNQINTGCVYLNGNLCGAVLQNTAGPANPCDACQIHRAGSRAEIPPAGDLLQLKEELDRNFEPSDPFHSRRSDYDWWKVANPVNLNNILYRSGIHSPLMFNPAVMMAHYKYRHLIVGIFTRKGGKKYVVCGVPGMYMVDEKPFARMSTWVQAEGGKMRHGTFGYWLVYINPENGKLLDLNRE